MKSKYPIHVGYISNINGEGYTTTIGPVDESRFNGHFHATTAAAMAAAKRKASEFLAHEGTEYEIVGPFAIQD